jgi:hypothetical protein
VIERKNRSIMEMARSLLKSMEIPGIFWAEAVRHSVYLLNRLPTKSMGYRTPYEGWNGRKPHLGHLRIFGCKGHVKIVGTHLKKLDDRSVPMVYFGIEEGSKAHRMYNPKTNKIVVSREVVFEESVKWSWESANSFSFAENRDEKDGQFYSGDYGSLDSGVGDAQGAQGVNETGGATSGGEQSVGGSNAEMGDYDVQTEQNLTTGSEPATPQSSPHLSVTGHDSMDVDDTIDTDSGPIRFRSLNEVYDDSYEVELMDENMEALLVEMEEPTCFRDATDSQDWVDAMNREIQSIQKNKTWELVKLPAGKKPIGLKWVFKLKRNSEGDVVKHKARLVAKGYVQKHGVDYEEVFAPVARLDTVRVLLALAANQGWKVHHLDVKSAFLHGELEEEVYVSQPEGYVVKGKEQCVLKLSKALYGLKQAPRAWNVRLDKSLRKLNFRRCMSEQAVYTRGHGKNAVLLGVYVDDLIITGGNPESIKLFKQQMMSEFEMTDLGLLSYYLGIEVDQKEDHITVKQSAYARKVLGGNLGWQNAIQASIQWSPETN